MDPPKLDAGFGFSNSASTTVNEDYEFAPSEMSNVDWKPESTGWSTFKTTEAPPAHLTSAQYSPTLNEAAAKLLDVRLLTQDDVTFFRHNMDLSREAIKYAKGVARLIMKKAELLETQLSFPTNGIYLNPVNLS
ncbi:unnamed protein product [Echinostoma caproni]|uniref:Rad21_Rec8 domain-containing protein n=1 Tax=Echinostoma caproni TaxID=27848 RepID=A0A183B3H5_9TREM|nr:unnamed protein product [Echinostoma caproni]